MSSATLEPVEPVGVEVEDARARQARLAQAVARLRSRSGTGSLDRWLLIIGGTLAPLGLLLIVLGWYGASHTFKLYEQIPYAISGGLLGVALIFAGGFVYFAYWLTRLVREGREQADRATAALERLEVLLSRGIVTLAHESEVAPAAGGANGHAAFVATPSGSMLHRPDCPVVANRPALRAVAADEPGFTPCKICEPV